MKIQYPGIRETIKSDVQMLKTALRAMPEYRTILPAIGEIETRLLEETDYHRELQNMTFFGEKLQMDRVKVPTSIDQFSTHTVLSSRFMEGVTLNEWLKTDRSRHEQDRVAQVSKPPRIRVRKG